MRMAAVGLFTLVVSLAPLPSALVAQEDASPAELLKALEGRWAFGVRKADGTVIEQGRRSFKATGPDRLAWTDVLTDGTRTSGYLLYNETDDRFVYGFKAASGRLCTVAGRLSGSDTIEFGRASCRERVYVLV